MFRKYLSFAVIGIGICVGGAMMPILTNPPAKALWNNAFSKNPAIHGQLLLTILQKSHHSSMLHAKN